MMTIIVYVLVIMIANILGAISGLGGGSIIKPVFDFLGFHKVTEISFYSSVAVFVMAISSTAKHMQMRTKINHHISFGIGIGSILGGLLGTLVFNGLILIMSSDAIVNLIQILIIIVTLIFSYIYSQKPFSIHRQVSIPRSMIIGGILGFLASFLGIGGGPLNVALLMYVYAVSLKEATLYSIISIIFSQGSKLIYEVVSGRYLTYDLEPFIYIVISAMIGGMLGAHFNKRCNEANVKKVYQSIIVVILFINLYNLIKIFIKL